MNEKGWAMRLGGVRGTSSPAGRSLPERPSPFSPPRPERNEMYEYHLKTSRRVEAGHRGWWGHLPGPPLAQYPPNSDF